MPMPGTHLRELYDALMQHKGEAIPYKNNVGGRRVRDLIDYYGLDIRRVGECQWVLAGEWFGKVYIDYIAARLEAGQ